MSARIVVADDDPDILRLVSFTLRRRGYVVFEAAAGDAALTLIRRELPDLVVCDVVMPGIRGDELAGILRDDPRTASLPIILVSASSQSSEVELGLRTGARAYIVKPFTPQLLAERVAEILGEGPVIPTLCAIAPPTEPRAEAAEPPGAVGASESEQLRALVADDDPGINQLIRTRLHARGYRARGASNGNEALSLLEEEPADILFLDVSMPGMGGLDVLERLRSRKLEIAVIMMTAFGSEDIAVEALRRGANDYLRKPFEPFDFQATLDRTAARVRLERQVALLRQDLDEKRCQLEMELARAAKVQAELLPASYPHLDGFELAARCLPAREVGGDFYDWQEPEAGKLTLALGDVMGKGMPAALLMASVRASLRATVRRSPPAEAMHYVVSALEQDLDRAGGFVTLFLAQLDLISHQLSYVDAGHGHGFVRHASGEIDLFQPRNLPLGVGLAGTYAAGQADLGEGDALVLYSDGLVERGSEDTLSPTVVGEALEGSASAEDMVDRLCALGEPAGLRNDDLTVLVLRRTLCQQ